MYYLACILEMQISYRSYYSLQEAESYQMGNSRKEGQEESLKEEEKEKQTAHIL